ncbi:MAG: T9SS type A sorting domain-containing protein [Ignavibacteria bacterium]|nr:T9SS type A sorting domain-containing protein [Ignavibacteria bacterium]
MRFSSGPYLHVILLFAFATAASGCATTGFFKKLDAEHLQREHQTQLIVLNHSPLKYYWEITRDGSTSQYEMRKGSYPGVHFVDEARGWLVPDYGEICRTTDGGTTWRPQVSGTTANLNAVRFSDGQKGWVVGEQGTILHTTDGGEKWMQQSSGIIDDLYAISSSNPLGAWTVGRSGLILKTFDGGGEAPTSVKVSDESPVEFALHQSFPNPFNPTTTIEFGLPRETHVELKVYTALGQEVATLASERLPAGKHTMQWDATGAPSGVYFCRMRAGSFVETRKLVLLR